MAKYLKLKSNHRVAVLESEARHLQGQNVLISKKWKKFRLKNCHCL